MLRTRVKEPVYHFGFSLTEGEHLTREQREDAVGGVLTRMGLADHQAILLANCDNAVAAGSPSSR